MYKLGTKLFILMLLFALVGCQNSDEIVSPETDSGSDQNLEKFRFIRPVNLNSPGENTCIELVARRNLVIGEVCIDYIEANQEILVTYNITDPDWTIVKTRLAVVNRPNHFPTRPFGRPWLRHFPYKEVHENVNTVQYVVDANNFNNKVYIAANAVVEREIATSGEPILIPDLPDTDEMIPTWRTSYTDYTVEAEFNTLGIYSGWALDNSRWISSGLERDVKFVSTYSEQLPACISFIENKDNLDLVNWIINNKEPNWDVKTIQGAIWSLINPSGMISPLDDPNDPRYWGDDPVLRETIISLAMANGEGYEPGCGEKVIILAYGPEVDPCNISSSIVGFEYPVECNPSTVRRRAWAFPFANGHPLRLLSNRFSFFGWARYFAYLN